VRVEASLFARSAGGSGLTRRLGIKLAVAVLVAGVILVAVLLIAGGTPTPTLAGLREIPPSALTQVNARLGTDGRPRISTSPVGSLTRTLTGAALLSRAGHTLHLEVRTQYYFRLKHKPPKGRGPAGWEGLTENYKVTLVQASAERWQVTAIKLIPIPTVGEG
jgi:hypothetical protein